MNFHDEILDLAPFLSSPIWREAYRLHIFPQNIGFDLRQQRLKNLGLVKRPALQLAFLPPLRHLEFTFAMETQVAKIDPTYKKARLHPLRLILAIPNNNRVQTLKPNSKKRKLLRFLIQLQIQSGSALGSMQQTGCCRSSIQPQVCCSRLFQILLSLEQSDL
ncbi:BnaC09g41600D [Brassica napus]|uniref:BnaC09g41600D protein n=1 Tax=Brassica napus TaxID=3708 RepID=A0A078GPC5_BRANA|nr:BnaC09g41600D [Brassica napus]